MKLYVGKKEVVPSATSNDPLSQQYWARPKHGDVIPWQDTGCGIFRDQLEDATDRYELEQSLAALWPKAERTALLPCEGLRITKAQAAPYRPPKRRR